MSGPEAGRAPADRVTVTRRVAAPAHAIFALVCDPARHVDIDGSGMLRAAPDARPLTAVGQTFDIEMDRRPLGDVPNTRALQQLVMTVPDYLVRCTVTKLIPTGSSSGRSGPWGSPRRPCLRLADRTDHRRRMPGQS